MISLLEHFRHRRQKVLRAVLLGQATYDEYQCAVRFFVALAVAHHLRQSAADAIR